MATSSKPLIFLAFANDQSDYLYNLKVELDQIRQALRPAVEKGLCELLIEPNATISSILDVFQQHRDRVAIFHYGGHANAYKMLLETEGGERAIAHSGGLTAFLAAQKNLQLVFINGCSSEKQARELKEAGVSLVIGTTQPIVDAIATALSQRFYEGLALGLPIGQAWEEAKAQVQESKGDKSYRSLDLEVEAEVETEISSFPWRLHLLEGAEKVLNWNLPEAAGRPLFDLPLPARYYENLPPEPFKGLRYFQKEDAGVFFGRGAQIRELYNQLQRPESLILFYGKSGAGKSSLLDAGLLPRLETSWQVQYQRRQPESGLSAALRTGLLAEATEQGIAEAEQLSLRELWLAIESKNGRPLLFILDQAEECFTRPLPGAAAEELSQLTTEVEALFTEEGPKLMGKLILAYRKEYHPEIKRAFQEAQLPTAELFLQHLKRRGIIEVVEGLTRHKETQQAYRLQIAPTPGGSLPEIIADDLLEDRDSPLAAMLQILLTKMWRQAKAKHSTQPEFNIATYQQLKIEGLAMSEFFDQQMQKLTAWNGELVNSGLVLDVLHFHTTSLRTAGTRSLEEIRKVYQQRKDVIDELLTKCKELYLLTARDDQNGTTSLAHDTLAPVVIDRFNHSDLPGQRALRILANKLNDFKEGEEKTYLDAADLAVLEQGLQGMKEIRENAQQLLEESRKLQAKRLKARKRNRIAVVALAGIIGLFGLFGWNQYAQTKTAELTTINRMIRASWKAGVYLKRNEGWVEGVRVLYQGIRPIMNLEKLQQLSPVKVFDSGPHGIEPDYESQTDFAHYNEKFVIWLKEYGIPGAKDVAFRRQTQSVYDDYLKEMAHAYYKVYFHIQSHPNREVYQKEYLQILANGGSTQGVEFSLDHFDPGVLGDNYVPDAPSWYLYWRFYDFADGFSKDPNNGEFGYHYANTACGFWLRRQIDGSADEFLEVLVLLLQTYDPQFLVNY